MTPPAPSRGRVAVFGPGPTVRGGITSVIANHAAGEVWQQWRCRWVSTYDDRSTIWKVARFGLALIQAPWAILRADIVHVHLAAAISARRKVPFVWLGGLFGRPVVLHIHAPSPQLLDQTPAWVWRTLVERAAVVVALSPHWKAILEQRWPGKRIVVLPNPVNKPQEGIGAPAARKPGTILFLGKLEARKGYPVLLKAFAVVQKTFSEAELWFAGHGDLAKARRLADELRVPAHVRFLGWVSKDERAQWLRTAALFCLPSYAEGVPMALLEAMAAGLPVIATPVGGVPDVIEDGVNGRLVPEGNVAALAACLLELLQQPARAEALGAAAARAVTAAYDMRTISAQLDRLYSSLWPVMAVRTPAPAHLPRSYTPAEKEAMR